MTVDSFLTELSQLLLEHMFYISGSESATDILFIRFESIFTSFSLRILSNRRKRRKEINERWTILTDQCEVFHNLPAESQAEHLINFLLKWSVGEPEQSEPFEQDPE